MKLDKKDLLLYAITDRSWLNGMTMEEQLKEAIAGGATIVQIREKNMNYSDFLEEAKSLYKICKSSNIPFIVNDNIDIAREINADGIHVGQEDMDAKDVRSIIGDKMILGVSASTVEEAIKAEKDGADYLGVGAVFSTSTKKDADSVSYEELKKICDAVSIPVVAIGGITYDNMDVLKDSGICGISVISAIFAQNDIRKATENLKNKSEKLFKYHKMPVALTIAGSDSSGGAGIQADIKTMTVHGVFAESAITALTAQNTTGVMSVFESSPEFLSEQLDSVFSDIYPDAVKIGMVSSCNLIHVISEKLREYNAKNIVVDPVMISTSGSRLIEEDAIKTLKEELFPLASVLTPNIPEAEVISGIEIKSTEDMIKASKIIGDNFKCAVLCKGGHSINDANDLLYSNGEFRWFYGKRIENGNTHGTGCTLSSAIASNLAKGKNLEMSVLEAKNYISGALSYMLDLGKGSGPMNHAFSVHGEYK